MKINQRQKKQAIQFFSYKFLEILYKNNIYYEFSTNLFERIKRGDFNFGFPHWILKTRTPNNVATIVSEYLKQYTIQYTRLQDIAQLAGNLIDKLLYWDYTKQGWLFWSQQNTNMLNEMLIYQRF